MPRYFFDTMIDGDWLRDEEGVGMPDLETAKREAVGTLYDLAREIEPRVATKQVTLCVRDSPRDVVFRAELSLSVSEK